MDILLFILSFVIILLGCEFFTNSVEWLGKRYNLSEGAVGSVLAAVGTAMPETLIPLIAIIFVGGQAGEDIGVGAILGAPFMLATLAMFICGLALFLFAKRRGTRTLHINGKLIRRDLKFFLLCYSLAVVAAFMPPDMQIIRWIIGFALIPIYIYYTYVTVKRREGQCETGDLKCLHFQNYADRLRGNRTENANPDEVSEAFRKAVYVKEPPTYLIYVQTFMGLLAIIVGANIFVNQIEWPGRGAEHQPNDNRVAHRPDRDGAAGEVQLYALDPGREGHVCDWEHHRGNGIPELFPGDDRHPAHQLAYQPGGPGAANAGGRDRHRLAWRFDPLLAVKPPRAAHVRTDDGRRALRVLHRPSAVRGGLRLSD